MVRILCLDDCPPLLIAMGKILRSEGYDSLTTTSSHEAWELLHTAAIDLLIQDLVRSDIDGFEFCRRMQSDKDIRDIPVILVTASRLEPDVVTDFGVDGYITKPFDPQDLLSAVASVLAKSRLSNRAT